MTDDEALEIYADVLECWPHSKDHVNKPRLMADIADVQFEHARVAVETMYRDGREHAPNGAQIRRRVAELALDAPDWGVVKAEIDRRRGAEGGAMWAHTNLDCPYGACDGTGLIAPGDEDDRPKRELVARYCDCREELPMRIAAATGMHPVVNEFIYVVGRGEIAALDGDRIAEAQVRKKYEDHVADVQRGAVYQGLNTAGLPKLERLQRERAVRVGLLPPAERGGLRKPDTRAALPAAAEDAA